MNKREQRRKQDVLGRIEQNVEQQSDGVLFAPSTSSADVWGTATEGVDAETSAVVVNGIYGTPAPSASQLEAENRELAIRAETKFIISATGVEFVGQRITADDVINKMREVDSAKKADFWFYADMLAFAQDREWGNVYTEAEKITKKSYQTLANYVWVARGILVSLRGEKGMTLEHYKLIVKCKPDEQIQWVRRVQKKGWSAAQLKQAIDGNLIEGDSPTTKLTPYERSKSRLVNAISKAATRREKLRLIEDAIGELEKLKANLG